jgi:hypothetical protein
VLKSVGIDVNSVLRGDLIDVLERQKMLHREKLHKKSSNALQTVADAERDWSKADALTAKISSAKIITVYCSAERTRGSLPSDIREVDGNPIGLKACWI